MLLSTPELSTLEPAPGRLLDSISDLLVVGLSSVLGLSSEHEIVVKLRTTRAATMLFIDFFLIFKTVI
jgi:hypothetical protein